MKAKATALELLRSLLDIGASVVALRTVENMTKGNSMVPPTFVERAGALAEDFEDLENKIKTRYKRKLKSEKAKKQ